MAVGIGNAESQRTGGVAQGKLQPVIVGICHVLQREDLTKTGGELPKAVGIGKVLPRRTEARRLQVDEVYIRIVPDGSGGIRWSDKSKTISVVRIAQSAGDGLAGRETIRSKRIVGRHCRDQLVDLEFGGEMGSLASDVAQSCDG